MWTCLINTRLLGGDGGMDGWRMRGKRAALLIYLPAEHSVARVQSVRRGGDDTFFFSYVMQKFKHVAICIKTLYQHDHSTAHRSKTQECLINILAIWIFFISVHLVNKTKNILISVIKRINILETVLLLPGFTRYDSINEDCNYLTVTTSRFYFCSLRSQICLKGLYNLHKYKHLCIISYHIFILGIYWR